MKDYEVKVLDEKDHLFIETLKNRGISRNVATIVTYLMNVDEKSSHEIEISTGLRQPEVSLAIRLMRNNSWIRVRSEKTPIDEIKSNNENKIYNKCRGPTSVITNLKVMSKKVPLTPSK